MVALLRQAFAQAKPPNGRLRGHDGSGSRPKACADGVHIEIFNILPAEQDAFAVIVRAEFACGRGTDELRSEPETAHIPIRHAIEERGFIQYRTTSIALPITSRRASSILKRAQLSSLPK